MMNPSVLTNKSLPEDIKGKRYFHVRVRYTRTGYGFLVSSPNFIPAYSEKQARQILQKRLMRTLHANDIRRKGKPDNAWRKIPVTTNKLGPEYEW